ncbi:MAG: hypothetical protein ACE144_10475 [Thermodesulfobacteriota bacterium]
MMRAQVSLTPTESKKLIAKAVAHMKIVQNAFKKGIVAIHPSSSTIFLVDELIGRFPDTEVWVCGVIVPKGACLSVEALGSNQPRHEKTPTVLRSPATYPYTWVVEKGELRSGLPLGEILDRMGPDDVYIKGVNAIDSNNTVGVLIGNRVEGGTFGVVMSASKRKGFKLIFPAGLEKLIPIPLEKAAEEAAKRNSLTYSMGMPCVLLTCRGMVVTELNAVEILAGATAVPIGAGGLGGAEGGVTVVIKGNDEQGKKAIDCIESIKGTKLPREVIVPDCLDCQNELCSLKDGKKPWC